MNLSATVQFLAQHLPWVWLAVCIACTIIEAVTFELVTIWFAAAALAMIFVSLLPIPFVWQLLVFLALSALLLVFSRPIALKKLKVGKVKTNAESLIGSKGLVIKDITEFDAGEVKISEAIWHARACDGAMLAAGSECTVERIEGATLYVSACKEGTGGTL